MNKPFERIFSKGSKTYFTSSLFFPPDVRQDVFRLYAFVRTADDFVDQKPPDKEGFYRYVDLYRFAEEKGTSKEPIIDSYISLSKERNFDPQWTNAFLRSMEMDLKKIHYETMEELVEYMYGSAEVIGLFMAKILGLPKESEMSARLQGRSMQMINFIRDIDEDLRLGRQYLPLDGRREELLNENTARNNPDEFKTYIDKMLSYYYSWQEEAEKGYEFIPKNYLIPIKTAADMYTWTAKMIERNPPIVYSKKIKPTRGRIILSALKNWLWLGRGMHSNVG